MNLFWALGRMRRRIEAARAAAERHITFTRVALKEILEAEARVEISLRRLGGGLSDEAVLPNGDFG